MSSFLNELNWRSATKKFDVAKPVGKDKLDQILTSIRMAPTSFGLQPFEVQVVTNADLKSQLQASGWGQPQFSTSTAVLVFVADTKVDNRIEQMMESKSKGNAEIRASMKDYEAIMKGWSKGLTPDAAKSWAQKQAYIALGFAMAACAELKVDSCPIEGFLPPEFDRILGLPAHKFSTVVLAVGTAVAGDPQFPKWRFSDADLFVHKP